MVSLVNFKLMPDDHKSHDQDLTLSSSSGSSIPLANTTNTQGSSNQNHSYDISSNINNNNNNNNHNHNNISYNHDNDQHNSHRHQPKIKSIKNERQVTLSISNNNDNNIIGDKFASPTHATIGSDTILNHNNRESFDRLDNNESVVFNNNSNNDNNGQQTNRSSEHHHQQQDDNSTISNSNIKPRTPPKPHNLITSITTTVNTQVSSVCGSSDDTIDNSKFSSVVFSSVVPDQLDPKSASLAAPFSLSVAGSESSDMQMSSDYSNNSNCGPKLDDKGIDHHQQQHRSQHQNQQPYTHQLSESVMMSPASRGIQQQQQQAPADLDLVVPYNNNSSNNNNHQPTLQSHDHLVSRHQRQPSSAGSNLHSAHCVRVSPIMKGLSLNHKHQHQHQYEHQHEHKHEHQNHNNHNNHHHHHTHQHNNQQQQQQSQMLKIISGSQLNQKQVQQQQQQNIIGMTTNRAGVFVMANGHPTEVTIPLQQAIQTVPLIKESPVDVIGCIDNRLIKGNSASALQLEQNKLMSHHQRQQQSPSQTKPPGNPNDPQAAGEMIANKCGRHFTVTWRELSFVIQPKWHQAKSSITQSFSQQQQTMMLENQQNIQNNLNIEAAVTTNQQAPSNSDVQLPATILKGGSLIKNLKQTKVVLDSLDGCFKSGELTAILGPSGAGKTTLLDCLTGHRKQGLSGSIKIRASYCNGDHGPQTMDQQQQQHLNQYTNNKNNIDNNHKQLDKSTTGASRQCNHLSNNLKVSIIPQNDHLIGHLTVYETLSYASKMKNCFNRQFDHKANIERVSQQLGLLSCLSTRINKLSGGQYKRVSIAQELLSNPDILILDEPTSGLDAMTCYQTVQVLRRLADNRQLTNNQIAIILTIHQPNSDVFQQFNHVYVVAQGGKSIYEGPPSSIVSVIQRVGLQLPSANYNPATMIVEVAAGKFGYDSITKLNRIQKKQYNNNNGRSYNENHDNSGNESDSSFTSASSSSADDDKTNNGNQEDCKVAKKGGQKRLTKKQRSVAKAKLTTTTITTTATTQDKNNNIDNQGIVNEAFQPDHHPLTNVLIDSRLAVVPAKDVCVQESLKGNGNESRKRRRDKKSRRHSMRRSTGDGGEGGKRLKLNSLKADQKFPFWRHTYLHFHRSWQSIVRDPMLCGMQLFLHIIIPIMVSMVYGPNVGQPNACPRAGPMDLITFALEPEDSTLNLQEELRTTLENIGYIFFKLYGIIFAAMTVTVLTFPLDMHVLVKEFRNGWYGLSSYFLGRTLADIPFQLTLPFLAMLLSYYATGQPYSYLQWRFVSITAILILSSLIAQSQGLLFGAILMDKMKAAVFVAPAATTPIILFAGFLVRTQSIPYYLRPLSNLSYLRYAIEACLISRYGFNQCECDPAIFNQTVPELPPIARTMLDYWLSSFKAEQQANLASPLLASVNSTDLTSADNQNLTTAVSSFNSNNSTFTTINQTSLIYSNLTTTTSSPIHPSADDYATGGAVGATTAGATSPDLFTKLIDSLAKANSFGRNITSCEQVVPYPMIDYNLKDSQLFDCFAVLLVMLIFTRFLTFFIVSYKVKRKV